MGWEVLSFLHRGFGEIAFFFQTIGWKNNFTGDGDVPFTEIPGRGSLTSFCTQSYLCSHSFPDC